MVIDLLHNKIVRDTATDKFLSGVEEGLLPLLSEKYGDSLLGVQMYEDYISDGFLSLGEWYYPLTVLTPDGPLTEWIKWRVDDSFKSGIPYAYLGNEQIDFSLADSVPEEFLRALSGRAIYCEPGLIRVRPESVSGDATFLSGKYSQTFIDELSRQITPAIASMMSVEGLEGGSVELVLTFAPETYMEHTSENLTYRRLLLADKSSAPRDFWVKWTRLDGATAHTVSTHVSSDTILFEIGEDVPQKIREREYRYLLRVSNDKYHNAMGRKNITEWRELIKRAVRRGELVKVERPVVITDETFEVERQLASVLGVSVDTETPEVKEDDGLDEITRLAMQALGLSTASEEAPDTADSDGEEVLVFAEEIDEADEPTPEEEEIEAVAEEEEIEETEEELDFEESEEYDELSELDDIDDYADEQALSELLALEAAEEAVAVEPEIAEEPVEQPKAAAVTAEELEEKIRAELEAKIRLEYESRARVRAEEEAERLRREHELLRQENERLLAKARRDEEERAREAQLRREKEERLKAELEAQAKRELIERERLAEAARLAVIEERRKEEERARIERERLEAEKRETEERLRAEEAARIEAERAREAERIRREAAERGAAPEAPKEEKRETVYVNNNYTYTSKRVKLLFRRSVDPNITSRIYEIIKATIEYYGKEKVYLKIKASIPDKETVILEFASIPMEEMDLLGNIIKVLGNSGLGIAKAIVE